MNFLDKIKLEFSSLYFNKSERVFQRTKHILYPENVKKVKSILLKEMGLHHKITRKGKVTYIGFEGINFKKILDEWNKYSKEYNYYKLHPLIRFLTNKNKIKPDDFTIIPHHKTPIYFEVEDIYTDQKIILFTKGTNLKFKLEETEKGIPLFENQEGIIPFSVLNLIFTEKQNPNLITEIYLNKDDFSVKEIKTFEK